MKGLLKILSFFLMIAAIICGVFLGRMVWMENALRKDLEELESYDFELQYHISGDCDILNVEPYETEDTPVVTKWLASYMKKMEQGGSITGDVYDGVCHAEVYAEGEEQPRIEFYYEDQAVFGTKKPLDYMIDTVEKETNFPVSILQNVTPDGYISFEQLQTILGVKKGENSQETSVGTGDGNEGPIDLLGFFRDIAGNTRLVLPASVEENYFQETLASVDISYCSAKTSLNGEDDVKLYVGISNETYQKYIYIRIDDLYGRDGINLELLLHINVTENEKIVIPETISENTVETLTFAISLINEF